MIQPTVGRVVWYTPYKSDGFAGAHDPGGSQLAAIVACVWSDTCVNLMVIDANGNTHSRTSVLLLQEGNPRPQAGFCEWMPYQLGQSKKTEAAEKALAEKKVSA